MSRPTVLFLGGNGHDPVRLDGARRALTLAGHPFDLVEIPYAKAPTYDALLCRLEETFAGWQAER